jgi:hypothetical protein
MPSNDVYLPDSRVEPVKERLYLRWPTLAAHGTEFVTVRHNPPFTGQMPGGEMGTTEDVVLQFVLSTPHPRREVYKQPGMKLTTQATLWEVGWLEAEREYQNGHYVQQDATDPLEVIYSALAFKHIQDIVSMLQLQN